MRLKGNKLIDYVLEKPEGTTLIMGDRQVNDLAEFDLFTWYEIEHKGNEIHIKPVLFY